MFTPTPTEDDIHTRLKAVLTGMLPAGIEIRLGQVNRVPEPSDVDFVVFWPIRDRRLATNIREDNDAFFTAAIQAATMTITSVISGAVVLGAPVYGAGVAPNTTVVAFGTGSGGTGTYTVSPSQTVALANLAAGSTLVTEKSERAYQLDVHGPNAAGNMKTITTLFRDEYATSAFEALGPEVQTLHADDPRYIAFQNAEQQNEDRWIIEVLLQADQSLYVPQQFASAAAVGLVNVEATFPP